MMKSIVEQLILEINDMQQTYEHVKTNQCDHDFYQIVQPYASKIDRLLNQFQTYKLQIIRMPYMNDKKFDLLMKHIEELSVECHFQRTSRKLFMEKIKSVHYDLQTIEDELSNKETLS
ncbi:Bacterial domain of uncharacterised function (DUF1798) [Staphylococcus simiae]|nr:Bacterial domain of uncharacterised function (DUF1798) [Staphylococcus simiae]